MSELHYAETLQALAELRAADKLVVLLHVTHYLLLLHLRCTLKPFCHSL